MQSDVGFVYRRVEELLKRDKEVMFVGTPCQVAGIKAYLGQTYKNYFWWIFIVITHRRILYLKNI